MTTNVLSDKNFTEDLDINLEEKFHEKEVEQNKNHFNTNIFFLIAFMIL